MMERKILDYEGKQINAFCIDGKWWYLARDIAEVMGINGNDAGAKVKRCTKPENNRKEHVKCWGRKWDWLLVDLKGVKDALLMASKKPLECRQDFALFLSDFEKDGGSTCTHMDSVQEACKADDGVQEACKERAKAWKDVERATEEIERTGEPPIEPCKCQLHPRMDTKTKIQAEGFIRVYNDEVYHYKWRYIYSESGRIYVNGGGENEEWQEVMVAHFQNLVVRYNVVGEYVEDEQGEKVFCPIAFTTYTATRDGKHYIIEERETEA